MIRFLDRKDLKELINQSADFNKRRYGSFMKWVSYIIILVAFAFALNVNKVLYELYSGVDMVLASDVLLTLIFMGVVAVIVTGYLLAVVHNLRYLLTAIEFQITMFSGAVRASTEFFLIANSRNTIVYADRNAIDIFSKEHLHTVEEFLKHDVLNEEDKQKIREVIASGIQQKFTITYTDAAGNEKTTQVSILPIDKPKGYFVIKGH